MEVFTESLQDLTWVERARVSGCTFYVLDPTMQDGKKLPCWEPKSQSGQFLGKSDCHASNIGMVHNLKIGNILSQYHVLYDKFYTTVSSADDAEPEI